MAKPNIFISHRWDYNSSYISLISKLNEYELPHLNYSVPSHDPLDLNKTNQIKQALSEQIRQCNYFVIFANMAMANSYWCKYEIDVATSYGKPILSVKPYNYTGNIPLFIQLADNQNGPSGFNTPAIIRKICNQLNYPIPVGL